MKLSQLKDTHRKPKRRKRVGRGPGSKMGKTSCRGHKGDKSRSGYKRRGGKEGGQLPLFQKLPHRGFSNKQFATPIFSINLDRIDAYFEDGEVVNKETLMEKGFPMRRMKGGFKVLGNGELTKKVVIEANKYSKNAIVKLEKQGIEFKRI
ncbi:50S ribosomal protein L15 [Candidatus Neptunochlamydia vexilliferae]|uniref:Large ribosomal subunit protein uL15 n=1 Tax=Candidatus Neptunichlamydia vexilliferae TaxID=1651774 RepID=A0ABS0AXJ8_9BACT|nr:50S ribosomal protein L15 [Candidatus Neptunochlamydia vexilliferae]MBF5058865.1 50S ribosomal protein L15 [Candidatus Neptunochlamydia vexilliferae]